MMTWFGVVNPAAGRESEVLATVTRVSNDLELDAVFEETSSGQDVVDRVTAAIGRGHHRFVAVGGDGTAHLVLNALLSSKSDQQFTLAVASVGSGSDFVRTFGHERGVLPGLTRLVHPELSTIDVGRATGSFGEAYFLNAMNIGVGAASAAVANGFFRWTGGMRYRAAFWVALWRFREGSVGVTVDSHAYNGTAINVVIANGQFFGGGMKIAPDSSLTDAEMDVQIFRAPRRQAFSVMPRLLMGTHISHRGVERYSGSSMRIEVPDDWMVEADGEILGHGTVEVEVLPQAVDFVI